MAANPTTPNNEFMQEARDLLPETYDALYEQEDSFGPAAFQRWHNRVVRKIFGETLSTSEISSYDELDVRITEYIGKSIAIALIDPAIDYWSKQVLSQTAGESESQSYKDRVEDLRKNRDQWAIAVAKLKFELEDLLPLRPVPATAAPIVRQAGEIFTHVTPDPLRIPPAWGPPEEEST